MLEIIFNIDESNPIDQKTLAEAMHKALRGSDCYINSDVILNTDTPDKIYLGIGDPNGENAVIDLSTSAMSINQNTDKEVEE